MKNPDSTIKLTFLLMLVLNFVFVAEAQKKASVEERNVRAQMQFLAGDALQGRGSGTQFERIAAEYVGTQFMQFGLEPAGEKDALGNTTFVQTITVPGRSVLQNLQVGADVGKSVVLGKNLAVLSIGAKEIGGELQKIKIGDKAKKGAVVFLDLPAEAKRETYFRGLQTLFQDGAVAVILRETDEWREDWNEFADAKPPLSRRGNVLIAAKDFADSLAALPDGTKIEMSANFNDSANTYTWNAVGKITGSDSKVSSEAIVLSAHLDHLGVRQNSPGDDKIFNGADDDASGTVAVLELARALASGKKPKRTIYFVCFGSEEAGGYGSRYFLENLPFPKEKFIANLQFEMLGRPDAKVKAEELWLTGFERSNLGAELAGRGAKLVADPHPEQNFFQRSDNYTFARQGIIAHTVSSYGLHTDYHRASDELKTIDFNHMTRAVNSMIKPIQWLSNSNFKPVWYEGKKPQ